MALRVAVADAALQDTLRWVQEGGDVAIFDATNTTRERRQMVYDTIVLKHGFKCLFLGINAFLLKYNLKCHEYAFIMLIK